MIASNKIEVLVSFDTTGSMYPCLTQVRRNAEALVKTLFKDIPDIRMGIIGQGDYCDGPLAITPMDLTNDQNAIVRFIRNVPKTNGGDAPECYEMVLHEARKMSWTAGATKVLVLIGDDMPHGPGERQNYMHLDWRNELDLLLEAGVNVYAVQALGRRHATPFYEEMARKTGGFHLSLNQFANVVEMIKAVCYKQVGDERLTRFEEELAATGGMNRDVDTFISILVGRRPGKRFSSTAGLNVVPPGRFQVLDVTGDTPIRNFAEDNGLTFKQGRGFYEFTKTVKVQDYKEVVLMDNATGDLYSGDTAREMAGIPVGRTASVRPGHGSLAGYTCFIQSTSPNRKLIGGTKFLYEVEGWAA